MKQDGAEGAGVEAGEGGANKARHEGRARDRGRARSDKLFRVARTVGELQLPAVGRHQNLLQSTAGA